VSKKPEDTPGRKVFREWCEYNNLKPNKTISDDLVRRIDEALRQAQQANVESVR
jgi:hypothetical protein